MKRQFIIYCEMDYDYLKNVTVQELFSDGRKSNQRSLPVKVDSYTQHEYILEIDEEELPWYAFVAGSLVGVMIELLLLSSLF